MGDRNISSQVVISCKPVLDPWGLILPAFFNESQFHAHKMNEGVSLTCLAYLSGVLNVGLQVIQLVPVVVERLTLLLQLVRNATTVKSWVRAPTTAMMTTQKASAEVMGGVFAYHNHALIECLPGLSACEQCTRICTYIHSWIQICHIIRFM